MTDLRMLAEPIGRVKEGYSSKDEAPSQGRLENRVSVIELDPELVKGLEGLKPGSWVWVILWFHEARPAKLLVHPRGNRSNPETGLFNSRSPNRPNPLGLDLGRIESIQKNRIVLTGLDAVTGTPVLDLKPYMDGLDKPDSDPA